MSVPTVYLGEVRQRGAFFNAWERRRHSKAVHWAVECFAEALGVWLYTWLGVGATAPYFLGNLAELEGVGSLLTVGFGYAFGILLAIVICAATSGGHFNPCVTIAHIVFNKFPVAKGIRYIFAQIFGGYIACLLVYAQYRPLILEIEVALKAAGKYNAVWFTQQGPAGIFALYAPVTGSLGNVFVNEFVADVMLGLTIWSILDPTNALVPPAAGPWIVSFAYGAVVWGFAPAGLAANTGRDLGGRLAAITIWGKEAWGGNYAALAALTNIPAMLFAVFLYELFLADSDRVIPAAQIEFRRSHDLHRRTGVHQKGHGSVEGSDTGSGKAVHEHSERV